MKVIYRLTKFFESSIAHYTYCHTCYKKFYIYTKAETRSQMLPSFYLTCPHGRDGLYTPKEVMAEKGLQPNLRFIPTPTIKIDRFNNSI